MIFFELTTICVLLSTSLIKLQIVFINLFSSTKYWFKSSSLLKCTYLLTRIDNDNSINEKMKRSCFNRWQMWKNKFIITNVAKRFSIKSFAYLLILMSLKYKVLNIFNLAKLREMIEIRLSKRQIFFEKVSSRLYCIFFNFDYVYFNKTKRHLLLRLFTSSTMYLSLFEC